jgi:uncharacterized protein (TIGR03083 family)
VQGPEFDALEAQTKELLAQVDELSDEQWDVPTRCPGWTVKDLVAHCEGMMQRLVTYNAQAVDAPAEIDRSGYYAYDPDGPREGEDPDKTFSEVIRDRVVEESGQRSPTEIREGMASAAEEMLRGVAEIPADRVIKRSNHPRMPFGELVATRVLEFGIHGMDISHATLRGERIHPDAVAIVKGILLGRLEAPLPVAIGWDDRTFILSGTGRRRLESNERYALGSLAAKFPLLR